MQLPEVGTGGEEGGEVAGGRQSEGGGPADLALPPGLVQVELGQVGAGQEGGQVAGGQAAVAQVGLPHLGVHEGRQLGAGQGASLGQAPP